MYERHYEHCIDFIRQALMCNFDPGILPFYWVSQRQQPTPDGNTLHKCELGEPTELAEEKGCTTAQGLRVAPAC